jgi:hypothetical protein
MVEMKNGCSLLRWVAVLKKYLFLLCAAILVISLPVSAQATGKSTYAQIDLCFSASGNLFFLPLLAPFGPAGTFPADLNLIMEMNGTGDLDPVFADDPIKKKKDKKKRKYKPKKTGGGS